MILSQILFHQSLKLIAHFFSFRLKNFFKLKNPKNLEKVTRTFFNHRRKIIKKPYNQFFGNKNILNYLKLDLNQRPQNLDFETYYKLTSEYEKLKLKS